MKVSHAIVRSSFLLIAASLVLKVVGYGEKLVMSYYFGTSSLVDAFTIASTFILSFFFLFRELIEPAVMNVSTANRIKNQTLDNTRLFSFMFWIIILLTAVPTVVIYLNVDGIVEILAPGFDADGKEMTIILLKIALPVIMLISLSTLTNILLNSERTFLKPVVGDLLFKVFPVVFMILFTDLGVVALGLGLLMGAIAKLIVHLVLARRMVTFRFYVPNREHVRVILFLTLPLLLGVGFSQAASIIDNLYASYLPKGTIAAISYARKVVDMPIVILPYMFSVVMFPYLTQWFIEKRVEELTDFFVRAMIAICLMFIPIAIFFTLFSEQIITLVFERGAFDRASTLLTYPPFLILSLGIPAFAIETILVVFFYANADTKTPVFTGIACVILNIAFVYIFINSIGYYAIVLAYLIQKSVKNAVLLWLLNRKLSFFSRLHPVLIKLLLPLSAFVIPLLIVRYVLFMADVTDKLSIFFAIGGAILISGGVYVAWLLGARIITWRKGRVVDLINLNA